MSTFGQRSKHREKVDSQVAHHYMRTRTKKVKYLRVGDSVAMGFHPSTAELRRVLHDRRTPRGVKGHIYQWLNYRRERARA